MKSLKQIDGGKSLGSAVFTCFSWTTLCPLLPWLWTCILALTSGRKLLICSLLIQNGHCCHMEVTLNWCFLLLSFNPADLFIYVLLHLSVHYGSNFVNNMKYLINAPLYADLWRIVFVHIDVYVVYYVRNRLIPFINNAGKLGDRIFIPWRRYTHFFNSK